MPKLNKLRDQASDNLGGKCWYCGCAMPPVPDKSSARCTAAYVRARRDGGKDVPENIVAACWLCINRRHRRKAPPAPEGYIKLVRRRFSSGAWGRFRVGSIATNSAAFDFRFWEAALGVAMTEKGRLSAGSEDDRDSRR